MIGCLNVFVPLWLGVQTITLAYPGAANTLAEQYAIDSARNRVYAFGEAWGGTAGDVGVVWTIDGATDALLSTITLPKLVNGAAVALSLDADRTVQDLVDAASALQAAGAPVVLDVSDSPCAPALEGMTCVPGGAAHVGGTAKNPAHAVRISTFYVDTAPVDVASYEACVSAGFCAPSPQGPSVGGVTWVIDRAAGGMG